MTYIIMKAYKHDDDHNDTKKDRNQQPMLGDFPKDILISG